MTKFLNYDDLYDFLVTKLDKPRFRQNDGTNFMLESHEFPCFKLFPRFEHIYVYLKKPVIGKHKDSEIQAGMLSLSCDSHENIFGIRFVIDEPDIIEGYSGQAYLSLYQSKTKVEYGMVYPEFINESKTRLKWKVKHGSAILHPDLEGTITDQCLGWFDRRYKKVPPTESTTNLITLAKFLSYAIQNYEPDTKKTSIASLPDLSPPPLTPKDKTDHDD